MTKISNLSDLAILAAEMRAAQIEKDIANEFGHANNGEYDAAFIETSEMAKLRASRALRLYRIFPVAELIRITGLLVTVAAILSAVAFPRGLQAAVFMVATALLAFGAADVIQETFAMRARRRRSDAIIGGPKAQTWRAIARTVAGLTCLMLSFVGFMIWASVTTEM